MLEPAITNKDIKTYLDIITRSSIKINDLVTELLTYQQPDKIQADKYSISQLLDEVLAAAEDRIMLKNIVLWKDFATQDCKTTVNRAQLKIALTNIIINAMAAGKGKLKVHTKSTKGKYIIQIEDNGCGISKQDMKHIFKPYFTNKPGGLGIGLATYDILQSNHVGVIVESEEGKGTSFMLCFEKETSI